MCVEASEQLLDGKTMALGLAVTDIDSFRMVTVLFTNKTCLP